MLKADVLAKLEEYKGRPIVVGLNDEGSLLYSGIDGHWLFVQGDNLVEIKKNVTDGTYGVSSGNQQQSPFTIMTVPFDVINYVKSYIPHKEGAIEEALSGLTPVGTDKSLSEIQSEIESDSILKALSPRGNVNTPDVAPGRSYGPFKGSAISTDIDGLPKYMDEIVTE